jgi:anaerobic magnesium-protoporphyrin IX monomethyl ester cyclase
MPNLGIANIAGNIDEHHEVFTVDLIRKRNHVRKYLTRTLKKIKPKLVGLSAMTWQYDTCIKIMRLIKALLPDTKIAIGGYHATLMYEEIGNSTESELIDFMVRGDWLMPYQERTVWRIFHHFHTNRTENLFITQKENFWNLPT